jgi:predicted TIM-barrel enzyme
MSERTFGKKVEILVITGSGLDQDTYKKYADFIITGTRLKRNRYWENEVDEDNVKKLVKNFK